MARSDRDLSLSDHSGRNPMPGHLQDVRLDDSYYFSGLPGGRGGPTVVRVSYEKWGPRQRIRRTQRDNYVIALVLRGRGTYRSPEGETPVGAGWVFSFAPRVHHEVWCDPRAPLEINRMVAVGDATRRLFDEHLGAQCGAWKLPNAHRAAAIASAMHEHARAARGFAHGICDSYFRILLMVIHEELAAADSHASHAMTRFLAARSFIEREYRTINTVAQAADACALSPEYLARLFGEYQGEPPLRFLQRLKMNRASDLLTRTRLTVAAVGAEVGLADPFTFSRAFKRWFGRSPRNYRAAVAREAP